MNTIEAFLRGLTANQIVWFLSDVTGDTFIVGSREQIEAYGITTTGEWTTTQELTQRLDFACYGYVEGGNTQYDNELPYKLVDLRDRPVPTVKPVEPEIFYFEESGDAYDQTQYRDDINFGDVLVVKSEGVVGLLVSAWPVAVTKANGKFHRKTPDGKWENILADQRRNYMPAFNLAVKTAQELGYELDT